MLRPHRRVFPGLAVILLASAVCRSTSAAPTPPAVGTAPGGAQSPEALEQARRQAIARYNTMIRRVAQMPDSERVVERSRRHGLDVLNVLWEDTGRWEGSSVGPNISDVTIEVELKNTEQGQRTRTALMPVLRFPNFSDRTGDVRTDRIWLPIGNQAQGDQPLHKITLAEFLKSPELFLSLPDEGRIRNGSLAAKRDSHVLVSAQAAFLPVPEDGEATFWPVIFNYQSTREAPAVLTLLVTRQGTSVTIVDNARDTLDGSWGQRLFYNERGQRTPLTAERLSRVQASGVTSNGEAVSTLGDDANVLMIIQVPLKVPARLRKAAMAPDMLMGLGTMGAGAGGGGSGQGYAAAPARSDMELAVLGHGPVLGPFTELDGRTIERDARFPVRVTVQFYQATATGTPTAVEISELATQIERVYASADYVGSLVEPRDVDRTRPTAWYGMSKPTKHPECKDFPGLVERGICALSELP
jgi:hypothetical protein